MNVKVMGLVVAGGIALAAAQASAVDFVTYNFNGAAAESSTADDGSPASSVNNGSAGLFLTSGGVGSLGGGTFEAGGADNFQARGWPQTESEYVTFTFTPNVNVSLTQLTFSTDREGTSTTTTPNEIRLRSSLTGVTTAGTVLYTNSAGTNVNLINHTAVLSSVSALQNIAANTAVTFRIYGFGGTSAAVDLAFDDVVLTGTVGGVPEPATLGLLAIGATALLRRRMA